MHFHINVMSGKCVTVGDVNINRRALQEGKANKMDFMKTIKNMIKDTVVKDDIFMLDDEWV